MTTIELARRAEQFYEERLKQELELSHPNYFVAVEPDSGHYFLGRTLSEASEAAHTAHPDRRTFVLRVGHKVTIHIGAGRT